MKIRLRIVEPADRRAWEEPYIAIYRTTDTGAVIGTAILEVLDETRDERDPDAWKIVEEIYD